MSERVIEKDPSPLMEAMEENLHGHVTYVQSRLPGMEVDERADLTVVDSGLASDTFNKILRPRLQEEDADARIGEAIARFERVRRPFSFWVGPCARPLDLEERLPHHGLEAVEHELGMTIDLDDLPDTLDAPAGAELRRVATEEDLAMFAGVLAGLAEPPDRAVRDFFARAAPLVLQEDAPMRFFVAYVEGEPAAVSELFLGGGLAGVHMVATSPRFRRRGLGLALTWKALAEGRRLGMATGALQASEEGRPVYERLGFQPCGRFVEYGIRA